MPERTLVLCPPEGELNPQIVGSFLEQLTLLDSMKGRINVVITSDGGWSQGGMAIYDAIRNTVNPVTTIGLGSVSSIAVLILQAGDTRLLGPNCGVFLHEMSWGGDASLKDLKRTAEEVHILQDRYCKLIADRSGGAAGGGVNAETVLKLCKEEVLLDAETALKLGLIDGILDGRPIMKKKK